MAREPFNRIWTETPTVDDFDEPTNTMWDAGWRGGAAEDPPEAYAQNWWQNRADFALRQLERNGAMDWHSLAIYGIGGLAIGSDGNRYASITNGNQGNDPVTDGGVNWKPTRYVRASGDAPVFGVRAWANADGSVATSVGQLANIRASGNVASITRTSSLGVFDVLFDTPMQDSNYSVTIGCSQETNGVGPRADNINIYNLSASGFTIECFANEVDRFDISNIFFQVVR